MFKSIENEWGLTMFDSIWTAVWQEKGYELEFSEQVLGRYVAISSSGEYVGTAEIKPYEPGISTIDSVAPFAQHPKIAADPSRVAEIDKIAVMREYRGSPLSDLLSAVVYCAEKHQIKYLVSLMEPLLFRALRVTFHLKLEKIGEKAFYKGDYVIPVLFDMELIYNNKSKYQWLVLPEEQQRVPEAAGITSLPLC